MYTTKIDNEEIRDSNHLLRFVGNIPPGKVTRFELLRNGGQVVVQVKLTARDEEKEIEKRRNMIWPGMAVVKITDGIRKQLDLPRSAGEIIIGVVDKGRPDAIAGHRR